MHLRTGRRSVRPSLPAHKVNTAEFLGLGVATGLWLKRRLPVLDRLDIPAPIAGGMVYALITLALHDCVVNFEFEGSLRDHAHVSFMTTVGLGASARLLREGGIGVAKLLALSTLGALLQNGLGMGIAKQHGVDARLGILAGAVSLAGGSRDVARVRAGVRAPRRRGRGHGEDRGATDREARSQRDAAPRPQGCDRCARERLAQVVLGVCMGAGALLGGGIERLGVVLPGYIGAMIVAAIVRNAGVTVPPADLAIIGKISLYLFIVMALLTLKAWELVHVALPILIILIAQVVLV